MFCLSLLLLSWSALRDACTENKSPFAVASGGVIQHGTRQLRMSYVQWDLPGSVCVGVSILRSQRFLPPWIGRVPLIAEARPERQRSPAVCFIYIRYGDLTLSNDPLDLRIP